MSLPDRGKLFEYAQKPKPSSPDFHGDCTIDGTAYELRGWHRDGQLALGLAPPKGDSNKIKPDVFRGALDPAPPKPPRGKKDKAPPVDEEPVPAWSGMIVSDEAAYLVRAFEKQGKSGTYFTLAFEKTEKPAKEDEWETSDATDEA
ncbi:MAG: hypothetical protein JNL83_13015 [Myxococcales bacterium]|nr:hypothetical protein [Myxococcales bacterium]